MESNHRLLGFNQALNQRLSYGSVKPEAGFEPATQKEYNSFADCRLIPLGYPGTLFSCNTKKQPTLSRSAVLRCLLRSTDLSRVSSFVDHKDETRATYGWVSHRSLLPGCLMSETHCSLRSASRCCSSLMLAKFYYIISANSTHSFKKSGKREKSFPASYQSVHH